MSSSASSGSEVEGGGGPNAVTKVSSKVGVVFKEVVEVSGIVLVKFWGPAKESLGSEARDSLE